MTLIALMTKSDHYHFFDTYFLLTKVEDNNDQKGILLVNLGTPDSPSTPDVRKYLGEFLMDERVLDIHPLLRTLLVKGIIAPFRSPKSAICLKVPCPIENRKRLPLLPELFYV